MVAPAHQPRKGPRFIKSADLPPEVAQGITEKLQGMFPGFEVHFLGDLKPGDVPQELVEKAVEKAAAMAAKQEQALRNGLCIDCGKKIPNWPPTSPDWDLPDGWAWFSEGEGVHKHVVAWQCPECDKAERAVPGEDGSEG